MIHSNHCHIKKIAFLLSIVMFIVWALLGTGASLAWFNDTSNELKNIFHVAEFDLDVYYRDEDNSWKKVQADTDLFDKDALYEPGHTQIAYLKVHNNGNIPFDWKTAVSVYDGNPGINMAGETFELQDYLKFGVSVFDTEQQMDDALDTRAKTNSIANERLNNYSTTTAELLPDDEVFIGIVVRMPEEVTNVANYKIPYQPMVYLGVIVSASQQQT